MSKYFVNKLAFPFKNRPNMTVFVFFRFFFRMFGFRPGVGHFVLVSYFRDSGVLELCARNATLQCFVFFVSYLCVLCYTNNKLETTEILTLTKATQQTGVYTNLWARGLRNQIQKRALQTQKILHA